MASKIAALFPGQGSQKPEMGSPWADHPSWALVADVSEAAGRDVAHLLTAADADELRSTANAQLASFALGAVISHAATEAGLTFDAAAGHSLGEYTALHAAGYLSIAQASALVAARGDAMVDACTRNPGTMAAVLGLDMSIAEEVCSDLRRQGLQVWVANRNSPVQVALSGSTEGVTAAGDACKEQGAKRVVQLVVEGAFHTEFMEPAQKPLDKALSAAVFRDSETIVAANVDGRADHGFRDWPDLLSRQLCSPVRWDSCSRSLANAGVGTMIELGPGSTLVGLVKRTSRGVTLASVGTPDELEAVVATHGS